MGGRAPRGPFKAISTQSTAKGRIIGRLECPARNCDGDALAKVDGMGWLQVTHVGCCTFTGRSHNAAHEIIEAIKDYPDPKKWAADKTQAEAEAALATLLEPSEPKAPAAPVFVGGVSPAPLVPVQTMPIPDGATRKDGAEPKAGIVLGEEFIANAERQIKAKKETKKPARAKRSVSLGAKRK